MHSKRLLIATVALALFAATGCATIFKGGTAEIQVESEPSGAEVYLDGQLQGTTPLTIEMDQRCGDYNLQYKLPGHKDVQAKVSTGFSGWSLLPFGPMPELILGTICTVDDDDLLATMKQVTDDAGAVADDAANRAARPTEGGLWPTLDKPAGTNQGASKDVAVIVGIEDYLLVSDVPGARANADAWFGWLTKERGLPYENVILLKDKKATDLEIRGALEKAAAKSSPDSTLWFVFIGHGAPSKDQKDGVLIGVDAQQTVTGLYGRSLARKDALNILSKGKQANTVVMLDSCFSGQSGTGAPIVAGLQPLLPISGKLRSKAVVLSAGSTDEFAGPLPAGDRPAFSYLMLGALRGWADANGDGSVTTAEALQYTQRTLGATLRGRSQTPSRAGSKADVVLSTGASEAGPDLGEIIKAQ